FSRDWSSDVCSSDLTNAQLGLGRDYTYDQLDIPSFIEWANYCDQIIDGAKRNVFGFAFRAPTRAFDAIRVLAQAHDAFLIEEAEIGRASCRESGVVE